MDIYKEKIILFGINKVQLDFEYIFENLNIIAYIARNKDEKNISLNKETYLLSEIESIVSFDSNIVICAEKKKNSNEKEQLLKHGFQDEKIYFVEELFEQFNSMNENIGKRKIAIWGTGIASEHLNEYFIKNKKLDSIDFYIDNNPNSSFHHEKKVYKLDEINNISDYYLVIATYKYAKEIGKQLKDIGLKYYKDFITYDDLKKDYSDMLRKTFFDSQKLENICVRPLGTCDIISDNVYVCCPSFLGLSIGSFKSNCFEEIWNSDMAKVLRLSVLNRTFSFCDKNHCDLYSFEEDKAFNYLNSSNFLKIQYNEKPKSLMVGIDASCNLQCPSCRPEKYAASEEQMEHLSEVSEDILENLVPFAEKVWMSGNGEVFFSKTYRKMLEDRRMQNRESISILTNGTLFNRINWNKFLKDKYKYIDVLLSLDGIKKQTIESLRLGANYEVLLENIKFLAGLRKKREIQNFFINCVIQSKNIEELEELVIFCEEIGVDKIQFLRLHNHGFYTKEEFETMSVIDENNKVKDEYEKYFTSSIMESEIVDWFNMGKIFNKSPKSRLTEYDLT